MRRRPSIIIIVEVGFLHALSAHNIFESRFRLLIDLKILRGQEEALTTIHELVLLKSVGLHLESTVLSVAGQVKIVWIIDFLH